MAHENQDMRTSFGFKRVDALEKQGLVNDVFSKVADRYDLMNDLMSGGLHRLWKADLINWLAPPRSERRYRLLDVAGGTGDIAKRFLDAAGPGASAIIYDISTEMMRIGKTRVPGAVTFVQGTAEGLPFQNRSMDAYTIAFGIRNVPDIDCALREAYRVLTPGGRFLCLEFSEVAMPLLDRIYDAWSFKLIPEIGRLAAGSAEPYQYLVESIRQFPNQTEFSSHIEAAGFSRVRYRNLSGGIAAIHSAWRL